MLNIIEFSHMTSQIYDTVKKELVTYPKVNVLYPKKYFDIKPAHFMHLQHMLRPTCKVTDITSQENRG